MNKKMGKKTFSILALLLSLLLVTAGCSTPLAADLMAGVKAAEKPASPDEPDAKYIASVAGFSWKLFQESVQDKGNVLVSPASVYLALAMTLNGADSTTRAAMLKAMAAADLTVEELNAASRDWMTLLMNTNKTTRLSIANSIWYRNGFDVDKAFLQRNADFFAAAARTLDFDKQSAVDTINGWVKDSTNGIIDKIVEKIDPAVVMYLINAVYFKAEWQTKFDAAKTVKSNFQAPAGDVEVKFMSQTEKMDYLSGDGNTGILLPYSDGRFAFVAVLPKQGVPARDLIASMDAEQFAALLKTRQPVSVDLRLPKFETRYEASLMGSLKNLGMGVAFEPGEADFSLMNKARGKDLFISEIKHKTFCRVDELGTEAAAVTSVEVSLTSMPVSDYQVTFDRPFIYGIIDTTTGLPLFLGVMENPAAS